ncbi:MAG: hypothetical protein K6B72_09380 [Lachnospiraceae bacterium]|nr:hypothetical protein [Lachnospiraceae bacterium]
MKKYSLPVYTSILVIVCITLVNTVCSFTGVVLPDMVIRILGIIDLVALVILVFFLVRLLASKRK